MNTTASNVNNSHLELPATAPQLRITAGLGSAGQKTWNIRRPVTLVGARRPAHIVVHDNNVSKAHCVIVNTGTEVLLKDLHTKGGTFQNNKPVDLAVLQDGDIIVVGTTKFHIAIRTPEPLNDDSGCGMEYMSPTEFSKPLSIHFVHSDKQWEISDAIALIGRHEESQIRLDHSEISERHAILFKFKNEPAMADLGSRTGVTINNCPCICGSLAAGDRLGIGPYTLSNGPSIITETSKGHFESEGGQSKNENNTSPNDGHDSVDPMIESEVGGHFNSKQGEGIKLGLQHEIADSWERINQWQARLREDEERLSRQDTNLAARETELEARDATMRGQLHDLSRYNEQIMARERELGAQLAELQEIRDVVKSSQSDLVKREGEMAKRNDELRRREHVLAQRWARLLSAKCSHCQQPVRPNHTEGQEAVKV